MDDKLKVVARTFLKLPVVGNLAEVIRVIWMDKLNDNHRLGLTANYLSWHLFYKPLGFNFIVTLQNGMKSIVYCDSDSGVSNIYTRNVDYYDTEFIRKYIKKGDFIVDVGCNVGNRTLVLADIIGGALLIDGNEICRDRLFKNFIYNGLNIENMKFLTKVAGSERKFVDFSDIKGTSCMNRILEIDQNDSLKKKKVEMTTIDYEMSQINEPCSFIKIDAEGFDLEVLNGAKKTLSSDNLKLVKFERWKELSLKSYLDFFGNIGWIAFALDEKGIPTLNEHALQNAMNLFAMPMNSFTNNFSDILKSTDFLK